ARADAAVGHVEGGETDFGATPLVQVKVEEINHVSDEDAINEVAQNPPDDQAERDLAQMCPRVKMMAAEEQDYQGRRGDDGQQFVLAAEHAPGRAGIGPVHELKDALDDHFL